MRGTRGKLPISVALAAALTFVVGVPQASAATNVTINGSSFGSTLVINDATNDNDVITVNQDGTTITVTDNGTGGATAAAPCAPVNANVVTCPLDPPDPAPPADPFSPVATVDLDLNNGTDNFNNQNLDARVNESDSGATGNKTVISGPGSDSISVGLGDDQVDTGQGFDSAFGDQGADTISTGSDEDFAVGDEGADTIDMGEGSGDQINEDAFANGADVLNGGPGTQDGVFYGGVTGVTITFNDQADDGHAGEGDNILGMEDAGTGDGPDTLTGNDANNNLSSSDGNDALSGLGGDDELGPGDGDDTVDGGDGDDTYFAGSQANGADVVNGAAGSDFVDYCCGPDGVNVALNGQPDDGRAGEGDNLASFEGFAGSDGPDTITADGASNLIETFAGDDTLVGSGGGDEFFAGAGDDTVVSSGGSSIARDAPLARALSARDRLECDLGFDTVAADSRDVVGPDCERDGAEIASDSAKVNKKGKAKVRLACPDEEAAACAGELVLLSNGKQVGKGNFNVGLGEEKNATAKLSKKGKKALKKSKGTLLVSAEARTDEPPGVTANADDVLLTQAKKGGGGKG